MDERVREIIQKCLSGRPNEARVTGSLIRDHVRSPFITYCGNFAPAEEKDPESHYLSLLAKAGVEHEQDTISTIMPQSVPCRIEDPIEAFQFAIQQMANGAKGLRNFPMYYVPLRFEGHIDLLRKNDSAKSVFGRYHYEIVEIKLAKNLKEHHIMQAAFYNRLIGLVQDFTPSEFFLINGEKEEKGFHYRKYSGKLERSLEEISAIQSGKIIPNPIHGSDCFPWSQYCYKEAIKRKDISIIPEIGEKIREKLFKNGFGTIEDIAHADLSQLTQVKGIGPKKGKSFRIHAEAILQERIIPLESVDLWTQLPEIFVDLEGFDHTLCPDGLEPQDFLFGALVVRKEDPEPMYHGFIVYDPHDEDERKTVFLGFLEILDSFPEARIYHWGNYDLTRTKTQASALGLEALASRSLPRFRDLLKVAKKSFAFPISTRSLKDLAPYLGFQWRIKQMTGLDAIVKYLRYMSGGFRDKNIVDEILVYNEDDLRALLHVKDWMCSYQSP